MPSERYVFPHRHLLGIQPLSPRDIMALLDQAQAFEEVCERPSIKIVPALRKKLVVNLFFENSTRTRNSFEIAEKRFFAAAEWPAETNAGTRRRLAEILDGAEISPRW